MNTTYIATAAAIIALAGQASAESGFPADFTIGVSGLSIGQSAEEAKAALLTLFPNDLEKVAKPTELVAAGATRRTGDRFVERIADLQDYEGQFPVSYQASTVNETWSRQLITEYGYTGNGASVLISSPETGGKVEAIFREIQYDAPKDPEAVREQVVEQFGEPHTAIDGWGYVYSFKDGAPMAKPRRGDQEYRMCAQPKNAVRNLTTDKETHVLAPAPYFVEYFHMNPLKARGVITNHCDANLLITPRTDDNGLVTRISFTFLDHKAMFEDMLALQAALEANEPPAPTGDKNVEKF